ncbi:CAP domain-containing protein [Weissella koreensis]|uniref:LysM peptidoglycan-binding domain-containing protein n=1 Tax=Weissella koreensis TaxID=165096 RepID=A0A7H1MKU2_9LACO|nr:CAP domain-containing protein [Weissella koreensis]AVH74876.1 hypothetical protein C4597_02055 [Weissella koreensis]QGN20099.1 LysM peptidoglycan-binding domain-containing protein [Weissella koreensis]QNT64078.1 LysM peptidoglycan-binding domain-containing protein [Weissella koreensis]
MSNTKKIIGTAIAAAASAIPFMGGHASADQATKTFRDASVDDVKKNADEAKNTPMYTVQAGDTLSSISDVTGVSTDDLQKYNNLNSSSVIINGSQLKLSGDDTAEAKDESVNADSSEQASSTSAASSKTSRSTATNQKANVANSTASTAVSSNDATLAALNAMRASAGLSKLNWDSGLAAKAQGRAAIVAASGIPSDHFHTQGEVIAIGFGAGSTVVSAWYNETNMVGAANGHRNWEMNSSYTHVGFGYVNGVIVGEAY